MDPCAAAFRAFFFRPDARGAWAGAPSRRDRGAAPRRTPPPLLAPCTAPRRLSLSPLVTRPPPARKHLWLREARHTPAARRTHARTCGAAQAAVHHRLCSAAPGSPFFSPQPPHKLHPHPTACAGLCGAQIHTQRPPPTLAAGEGARRYRGPQTARARHAFLASRPPSPRPHTAAHAPHPAPHTTCKTRPHRPRRAWPLHALHAVVLSSTTPK